MKAPYLLTLAALLFLSGRGYDLQAQEVPIPDPIQAPDTEAWTTTLAPKDSVRLVAFLKKGCQDSTYFVGQLKDARGVVVYSQRLASYVITSGVEGSTDSYFIYILCDWPPAAQWVNKGVIFSGRRYQARGILPQTGGEANLYLYLTAISEAR
jgi:hypothetical protein